MVDIEPEVRQSLKWLIAEVERLKPYYEAVDDALVVFEISVASGDAKKDVGLLGHSAYEEGRFFAAKRCAEIADDHGSIWLSKTIRKDFGIGGSE